MEKLQATVLFPAGPTVAAQTQLQVRRSPREPLSRRISFATFTSTSQLDRFPGRVGWSDQIGIRLIVVGNINLLQFVFLFGQL